MLNPRGWPAALLVALASAMPPLLAALAFGLIETPDSAGYLAYAAALRAGPLPMGDALLQGAAAPVTLFRTIGYPAVLAALQSLSAAQWPLLLIGVQMAAQSALAVAAWRCGLALGLRPWVAVLAALMPATGYAVVVQPAVMTDALCGALLSGAVLALLRGGLPGGGWRWVALAGGLLGLATPLREATPYLALGLLPAAAIAAGPGRRLAGLGLLLVPPLLAAGLILADHHRRSGHAVLSTSRQVVMVQAVLPLLARGVPVYDGDDLFDRSARETVVPMGYAGIDPLNARLAAAGLTAPEIASLATDRYRRAWQRHPLEMLRGMAQRFPVKMLWVTFMPVDTLAELYRQTGHPRPWFGRPEELLRQAGQGSVLAGLLLLALGLGRAVGLAVSAAAIAAPLLLPGRDARRPAVLGAWLACGALVGVYLPVHIEQRYLIPVVPVLCLLGVLALGARRRPA